MELQARDVPQDIAHLRDDEAGGAVRHIPKVSEGSEGPLRIGGVTGHVKSVSAVYRPKSIEDVIALVRSARISGTPLYPISTGFNWGYGSQTPVTNDCVLVNLEGMNRIVNASSISIDHPVALIEPGVTQIQLYEFLEAHCPELTFNVTGAGRDTSILGNGLDRGVGYQGPRVEDLFGLEIVTGTGEVLHTGFRRLGDESPLVHSHPYGLGPMLDGLFYQGNFGIVTSACLRLHPKRPERLTISLAVRSESALPSLIDELARLKRDGLLTSVAHVGNRVRARSSLRHGAIRYLERECGLDREDARRQAERAMDLVASGEWTGVASITGNREQVRGALREIRARTNKLARLSVVDTKKLGLGLAITHRLRALPWMRRAAAAITAAWPLYDLALGVPTDLGVENLLFQFGHANQLPRELDQSRCGLLFISPAMPLDGALAADVITGMKKTAARYHHELYTTINIETALSLVAVVNILFDRASAEETDRAHKCADALYAYIRQRGLEVYRARADMMGKVVTADGSYWPHVRALKQALDPDDIIAPGRYNLP